MGGGGVGGADLYGPVSLMFPVMLRWEASFRVEERLWCRPEWGGVCLNGGT